MLLVCDAPVRAERDRVWQRSKSDAIAGRLTEGIGNVEVLTAVEGWKTDGINRAELERLLRRARVQTCRLREYVRR